jgi:uncharacterized membrane protein YpjA
MHEFQTEVVMLKERLMEIAWNVVLIHEELVLQGNIFLKYFRFSIQNVMFSIYDLAG